MQTSFSELEYVAKKKQTRRDRFLAEIGALTPWPELLAALAPFCPKGDLRDSCRIAHVVRLGRIHPDLPADLFFTEVEWTGAYVLNKKRSPKQPPSVRDVVRLIAQLGGFLARKGDCELGVKSRWLGMTPLRDFALTVAHLRTLAHDSRVVGNSMGFHQWRRVDESTQ